MKAFVVFLFSLTCANAYADFNLLYSTSNRTPLEWGLQSLSAYMSDSTGTMKPGYGMIRVKENDPLLVNPRAYLLVSTTFQGLILRSAAVITAIDNAKRKAEIRDDIEDLLRAMFLKNEISKEGFDVRADTQAVRVKIDALKVEYNSLP